MKLKSIEIQGFKSFPDRTKLEFKYPITAVVGPNGSGKSNIADAVRWVLGEQSSKSLRGAKMEDVIFGGTQARKSQGYAMVTLTIDNTTGIVDMDSDEVSITRKLYRSGDSEYKINQNSVRLKDVHSLFMDTGLGRDGYSIISQGKIAEIVSAKSKERREIFEEAAGIAKYRYQKSEAEKRLVASNDNLDRLKDILFELEQRRGPLEKESAKAKEFVELSNEKKILEISLWLHTINGSKEALKEHSDKIDLAKAKYDEALSELDNIEAQISDEFMKMQNCASQIDLCRGKIKAYDEENSSLDAEIAVAHNTLEHNYSLTQQIEEDIKNATLDDAEIDKIISTSVEKISEIEKSIINLQAIIKTNTENTAKVKEDLKLNADSTQLLKAKRSQYYKEINDVKLKIATSKATLEQSEAKLNEIEEQQKNFAENLSKLLENAHSHKEFTMELEERIQSLTNSKSGYELKLNSRKSAYEEALNKQRNLGEQISAKEQRAKLLTDMENSMEGFNHSVKFIHKASQNKELSGIIGTLSSVIHTEDKYALAIETALGAAMQNIIVKDEYSAKQAIEKLRRAKAGRATFLPLTSVKGKSITDVGFDKYDGYIGIASDLVSFDKAYFGIISSFLGRIIIADDLDNATALAKAYDYRYRVVTLDGQVINAGGSFTGGSRIQSSGVLSRRSEINNLLEDAKKLKINFEDSQASCDKLKTDINAITAQLDAINSEILTANEDKFSAQAEYKIAQNTYDEAIEANNRAEAEKKLLAQRAQTLLNDGKSINELLQNFESELAECENELERIAQTTLEKTAENESLNEDNAKLVMELFSYQKDKEALQATNEQYSAQKQNQQNRTVQMQVRLADINEKNAQTKVLIDNAKIKKDEIAGKILTINEEIKAISEERLMHEKKSVELRNSTKNYNDEKEKHSATLARLEEKKNALQSEYDGIIAKLWEEYELTRTQAEEIALPVEDATQQNSKLISIRNKIRSLGNVNVNAIEEYEEVNTRYIFLKEQLDDVENSRDKLLSLIHELTAKMQSIFMRRFEAINENFSKIFVELFGGGRARLELSEPENVLDSGIDIFVQPPGKLIKSLQSLSGGEQAFVAIAIYFSILKVNPSPFCLLDEIEAALDDVNVSKYARYLRRMSDNTQFITITHRRGTMEEADTLYGVTMQEEGVSKLLELRVAEIEAKLGMKAEK